MAEKNKNNEDFLKIDEAEISLPETSYIRDIETKVFQGIVLKCLSKIKNIGFMEGNIIDSLLGREGDKVKGILVEQDQKKHSVYIRVEVNVKYGVVLPEKAEEIQNKVIEEITNLTGLHVSSVHVIFKNLIPDIQETHENEEKSQVEFKEKNTEENASQIK